MECTAGGESFRIDLALRIALSRLLARQAGVPLPTLIIVITHIDELKDAFPVRIEVTKTNEGSTIAVR